MDEIIVIKQNKLENLIQITIDKAFSEYGKNNPQQDMDKFLTIQEAMMFLNLARQTLYGFTSKNEIPFIKRGKKLYFRKSDLENWLLEGKRKSKSEILKDLEKFMITDLQAMALGGFGVRQRPVMLWMPPLFQMQFLFLILLLQ